MVKELKKKIQFFDIINYIFMIMLILVMLYPLWYVVIASVSSGEAVTAGKVILLPQGLNMRSYKLMFEEKSIWLAYGNTIFYTFAGTLFSICLTALGAYPLSKHRLPGRKFLIILAMLPMWLKAGMMPTYLNLDNLGLLNTRIGIILAFAVNSFYVLLMKNYFEAVPDAIEEAAIIDGASDFKVFREIYLPLSVPAIMTLSLYYFVARWNSYLWPMLMLKDEAKIPLQVLLRKIIVEMNTTAIEGGAVDFTSVSRETILYSTIVIAVVPMLALYPFIQKFFVKGIMIGSVKG